ncbi:nucleosome assembly protein [Theileria orientalis strain Shintoku]|uniref:Nucleosome assembly protein n=1 Tax=Theileria orientalis strain Shintoku TaxID=869250 RepID=J4C2Z9_THEOR|nr:nucleosome assembly protein [Theileria orientalis strain Shintoku]PVC49606.1 nucleosome assembly protein [Theileria orientalis]BAM39571.1 nucleosome assembly protein [Theileria orientalis strain Shintoku]|eukprot:XP_009689872.1 nucleosome assembly protein [Theileria orientalis strain Shintoku]
MKRNLEEDPKSKQALADLADPAKNPLIPFLSEFDEVQKALMSLDEECANEQMNIQRMFDKKKQPYYDKRQEIIDNIPGFWCKALTHHPALCYLTSADIPVLEQLKSIELYDNLDNNGSYKLTLNFSDKASEFMSPLSLTKHVVFNNNKENVKECTKITWKPGKSPVDEAIKARKNDKCIDWSLFEWFTEEEWLNRPDIGEIIRREVWHAPLAYYMDTVSVDFFDDEYEMLDDEDEV